MKRNSIRPGLAAVLALVASDAMAAGPTPAFTPPADGSSNVTDLSGATATDNLLLETMLANTASAVCDPAGGNGTAAADVYTADTNQLIPGVSVTNFAVVCKPRATIAGLNNQTTQMVRKYSGGSGSGISNVASGSAVANDTVNKRIWVEANSAGCANGTNVPAAGGRIAYNVYWNCAATPASVVTKGGLSDVEPALLGTSATVQSQLTINPGIAVDFAPIVSTPLFNALQTAEHKTANGIDDPANMPNLSKSQIRAILTGAITSRVFLFANPVGDTGAASAIPAAPSGSSNIFLCRRGDSSGTETGFATYFLHQGCGTAGVGDPNLAFIGATNSGCTAAGCGWNAGTYGTDRVFAGTGSQDVVDCMDFHSTNGDYAVGVLTTELAPNDGAGAHYRHVKIDGSTPSLENIQMGAYDFFTENTFQVPNNTAPNFANVTNDQSLISAQLLAATRTTALLTAALVTQGTSTGGTAWWGGALGIPTSNVSSPSPQGTASVHALVQATPVNSMLKAKSFGGTPNNCNPPWMGSRSLVPVDSGL